MPKLNWIPDETLTRAVRAILVNAKKAQKRASEKFGINVIDPFSAIFEISGFEVEFDEWLKNEEARQAQKTLQNSIGNFHQIILGSCEGWVNMKSGKIIDLYNKEEKIIAELKNKFNTVTGGKLGDLYHSLEKLVMDKTDTYRGHTVYYVHLIPAKPIRYNKPFAPSNSKTGAILPENPLIRVIDGASFYELVTGEKDALANLYAALPDVISEITSIGIPGKDKLSELFEAAYGRPQH